MKAHVKMMVFHQTWLDVRALADTEIEWLTQLDESDSNDETLQTLLAGHCIFLRALLALGIS